MNAVEAGPVLGILRPFNPVSWFHPRGIHRVLARLKPRLPDVAGCLFLTFTFNPQLFADPSSAFDHGRGRLRRIFFRLRRGVEWQGKQYVIDAPYMVKVEFHQNGWAHFHIVFLTHRFLPAGLLNELWGLGRTNVQRVSNDKFQYLLKYVTKGGGLPDWAMSRNRVRVFQSSRGFLLGVAEERAPGRKHRPCTLGERLLRWRKTALFQNGTRFQQVILPHPFYELVNELVYPIALDGRYLGGGFFQINDTGELEKWLT